MNPPYGTTDWIPGCAEDDGGFELSGLLQRRDRRQQRIHIRHRQSSECIPLPIQQR